MELFAPIWEMSSCISIPASSAAAFALIMLSVLTRIFVLLLNAWPATMTTTPTIAM